MNGLDAFGKRTRSVLCPTVKTSWYGGFGCGLGHCSGLGGSVAYFPGHISNFTNEVLMKESEKEEESPDSKRKDADAIKATLRSENQRLEILVVI